MTVRIERKDLSGSPGRGLPGVKIVAAVLALVAPALSSEPLLGTDHDVSKDDADPGARIYQQLCSSCHGKSGEGVQNEHASPLVGDKSVSQLAKYIAKSMPEDAPQMCKGEDAEKAARYIHDAFYSPIAQARNKAPRIELSRLTVRQVRNAIADLVGSFRAPLPQGGEQGLRGEYFNSRRPGDRRVLSRVDPQIKFDFGRDNPSRTKLGTQGFAARWQGSVIAPATGDYEFIVRTDHAVRFWLNDRDAPLIDRWVKSGDDTEFRASRFLIEGRAYPLRLEFTSRTQGVQNKVKKKEKPVKGFIELRWKLPRRPEEVIPALQLSPESASETFVVETPFPPDDRSVGYVRGTSISRAWDDATTAAAIETAAYVTEHLGDLAGVRKVDSDDENQLREFSRRFVERAFRRPLSTDQQELYVDRQFARAPDLETAVKRVVLLALKSPRFLYLDFGSDRPDAHSVASRLSFALWDSIPDEALRQAAKAGELLSRERVARQTERMIPDRRTRSKIRQFLHLWLDIEPVPDLAKDENHAPAFDEELASDLRTSLDLFLDDVIWGEGSDFRQLLLSSDLYLNGRLANYYGFDLPRDAPFQKIAARQAQRAGVVSHPYLMARFAYRDSSSPIHRGVFIVRGVLGRSLRPPPEAVAPLAADLHPELTTRQRVEQQTEPKVCQGCHGMINPLGFAFENFDAVGRYRDTERGKPIDASGWYELVSGEKTIFEGARDLAEFLATSEQAQGAFVLQLFHHLVKQPIFAYGVEMPKDFRESFAEQDFDVRKLIAQIATTAALAGLQSESTLDPGSGGRYDDRRRKSVRRRKF